MRFPRAVTAALLCATGSIATYAASPIELDDFYRLADVAEPVFSPDGSTVAYTVTRGDRKKDQRTSDIWLVPWSGGKPAELTRTPDVSESQPRFAKDGRSLFFLSDASADDTTQLWTMPARAGATARQVTRIPGGIRDYDLSPDGRRAAVIADVGLHVANTSDTPPPIETDRFVFKWDGEGYLDDRTQQVFIVDLRNGKSRQLTRGERDHWQPSWSPDGRALAYTAKDRGETDRDLNYDIYVQAVDGGEPKRISTSAGPDSDPDWGGRPAWSPDSRRVVWLEGGEGRWFYYAPVHLAVADVASGDVTRPANIDRWFYQPKFTPDGAIVALVEQDRDTWLARVDAKSGRLEYLTSGRRFGSDFAVASNGRLALLDSDVATPAELFAVDEHRQLTHHNDWLAGRALGEVRDVSFASGDVEIHGYVTLPPGATGATRHPLIADLHGGPVFQHSHEFDLDARLYAAAGYAVLALNPRGSSGRGFDFARAIYADWGNLDVKDISAGITYAIEADLADHGRVGAAGWSYGGNLTDYMIASDPRNRAAVSGAGVANVLATFGVDMYAREYLYELGAPWEHLDTWTRIAYPFLHAQRISAPTLFQCASADDNVPCAGAQQMYLALKTRGVPTHLIVYPGENHGLTVPSYLVHRMRSNIEWFDRWLGR
jgi:dipeptidyl aminopeptidase/acylaminoacyl peptidase